MFSQFFFCSGVPGCLTGFLCGPAQQGQFDKTSFFTVKLSKHRHETAVRPVGVQGAGDHRMRHVPPTRHYL